MRYITNAIIIGLLFFIIISCPIEIKKEKLTRVLKKEANNNRILNYIDMIKDGDTINNTIIDKLDGAFSVTMSPDGSQVYVTSFNDHSLVVFNRKASSEISDSGIPEYSATFTDGVSGVNDFNQATSVASSFDGRNVYVTSFVDNALTVFDRDVSSGVLKYSTTFKNASVIGSQTLEGLWGAYSVVVSPDDKNVYVAGYLDNALAVFNRNINTGALTYSAVLKDGASGVDGLGRAASVAVSSDGNNVYVASQGDQAIAVFNRNASTGALSYASHISDNDVSGSKTVVGLGGARAVTVSNNGRQVYVTGFTDHTLVVFNRDTTTGALTYSTEFRDGVSGVEGMRNPSSVSESPDGSNVYVTGYDSNALVVFTRNTSTGALTYSKMFKNGVNGVDGLALASSVTVSPDGLNVYVASQGDDAVVIFEREVLNNFDGFK